MADTPFSLRPIVFGLIVAGLGAARASADALYSVTDEGPVTSSPLAQGEVPLGFDFQYRATLLPGGGVGMTTWGFPLNYSGPLPDNLNPGAYGNLATVTSQAGTNLVGWGFGKDRNWDAFADLNGTVIDLGHLAGDNASQAFGVNLAGAVVGQSGSTGDSHEQATLYTQAHGLQGLGTLGGSSSVAFAINNAGQIVGESTLSGDTARHAFTSFGQGPLVDLNQLIASSAGFTLTRAMDINDVGQIAALGTDGQGVFHMLLLSPQTPIDASTIAPAAGQQGDPGGGPTLGDPTPVPEPMTLAIFALAFVTWPLLRRSRRRPMQAGPCA